MTRPIFAAARSAGFTLIELLMTVVLLATLAAIALPSLSTMVKNNRLESALGEMQYGFTYARSEAVTRRQQVTVCATTDGTTCNATNPPPWQTGMLIFIDNVPTGKTGVVDTNETILKYIQLGTSDLNITSDATPPLSFFNFTPSGNAGTGGSLTFCDARSGPYGRRLQVFVAGRTESSKGASCPGVP